MEGENKTGQSDSSQTFEKENEHEGLPVLLPPYYIQNICGKQKEQKTIII
jgi:hypothetical protein